MSNPIDPGAEKSSSNDDGSGRALFAATWYVIVVLIRMYRFLNQIDRKVAGFLPVLSEIIEHWDYTDSQWVNAYRHLSQGTIQVGSIVVTRQNFSWRREGRWGHPLTSLEWKKQIFFGPPGMQPAESTLFHTEQPRLPDSGDMYNTMQSKVHKLHTSNGQVIKVDDDDDETLHDFLERNDQIVLMYGLNFIEIPNGYSEPIQLGTLQEEELRCLLFSRALAISVLLVAKTWWFPIGFALMAVVPLYKKLPQHLRNAIGINRLIQRVDQADWNFCRRVGRDAVNIEVASRVLRDRFITNTAHPNRTFDVILFYGNRRAWCRCQPNTPGDIIHRDTRNTWIEFCIPTQTPWRNRVYYFIHRLVHTIVPWGHNANWVHNLIYAFAVGWTAASTHVVTPSPTASLVAATIMFVVTCIPGWLPNLQATPWGEGDVTVVAWYVLLLRIVLGKAFGGPILKVIKFVWKVLKILGIPIPALPSWLISSSPQSQNHTAQTATVRPSNFSAWANTTAS
jgi:hypothetical protein